MQPTGEHAAGNHILLRDVMLRFRMSYDKSVSIAGHARDIWRWIARGVAPHYFVALQDISLEVRRGEILGIIGPNGCGKSTLLRTIAGIYHPDAGVVDVAGKVSVLLTLGTGFDINLSGRSNIMLNGLFQGMSKSEIAAKMEMIVDFADIGEHIDHPMKYYSSGMMSRLSFAMTLAMEPDILLIDETLSVGDLAFSRKSKSAMAGMRERASIQLIVSHDLDFLAKTCTRVIAMQAGRIIDDGPPAHVIDGYRKRVLA